MIRYMDLESLVNLRQVSKFAAQVLDQATVDCLPRMRALPGTYGLPHFHNAGRLDAPLDLVILTAAQDAAIRLHGSVEVMAKASGREFHRQKALVNAATDEASAYALREPLGTRTVAEHRYNAASLMASVRAPWLDRATERVGWGIYCDMCTPSLPTTRFFTPRGFEKHIEIWGLTITRDTAITTRIKNNGTSE
jgi:hypothetical protein